MEEKEKRSGGERTMDMVLTGLWTLIPLEYYAVVRPPFGLVRPLFSVYHTINPATSPPFLSFVFRQQPYNPTVLRLDSLLPILEFHTLNEKQKSSRKRTQAATESLRGEILGDQLWRGFRGSVKMFTNSVRQQRKPVLDVWHVPSELTVNVMCMNVSLRKCTRCEARWKRAPSTARTWLKRFLNNFKGMKDWMGKKNGLSGRGESKEAEGTRGPSPNAVCTLQRGTSELLVLRILKVFESQATTALSLLEEADATVGDGMMFTDGGARKMSRVGRQGRWRTVALTGLWTRYVVNNRYVASVAQFVRGECEGGSSSGSRCTKIMPKTTSSNGHRLPTTILWFLSSLPNSKRISRLRGETQSSRKTK